MQFVARAELDVFGSCFDERVVALGDVERVAGLEHFVVVGEAEGDLAFEDVAPVRARAAVVGEPLEERRRVDRLREGEEVDRVIVEILVCRSSTGPWFSTFAALSLETFGISLVSYG